MYTTMLCMQEAEADSPPKPARSSPERSPGRSFKSSFKSSSLSVEIPTELVDDAADSAQGPRTATELRVSGS